MKLFLDDERPCPLGWVHVKTAWQAIGMLSTRMVTEVSLDHDLGGDDAGTGYNVICWLEEVIFTDASFPVPIVYVHTANPSARVKMIQSAIKIETIGMNRQV